MDKKKVPFRRILFAFIVLPVTVTILIPITLHTFFPRNLVPPFNHFLGYRSIAVIPAGIGLGLLYRTNLLFFKEGEGTLAPWDAPKKLVIKGPYCYMRQPMIAGVLLILMGEIIFLASWASVIWFLLFLIANLIYIPLLEEKKLADRFGSDYLRYQKNVRSWYPRLTPWDPDGL